MAICQELWALNWPAAAAGPRSSSAVRSPEPQSLSAPFLGSPIRRRTSCRLSTLALGARRPCCGSKAKRSAAVVMEFGAAENGSSPGETLSKVIEQRRVIDTPEVQPAVARSSLPRAQIKIPCLFMRGGTSRGTYFLKQHLPQDKEVINNVLLRVMGSPDQRQINGLGGATSVTSKVAIISVSKVPGIDVDYTFAQVTINEASVNWEPTCGNMLAGVGPAAIEMGLITKIGDPVTSVKIRATNNGTLVEALVQTPGHELTYEGDVAMDGVPGQAAPITLNFMHVVGSKTGGKLLPTGNIVDTINGVEVTCMDVAMPVVIAKASSLGKTGYESKLELDLDKAFFKRIETIRKIAGEKMGFGDVTGRVIPKFAIVAEPRTKEGNISARYFVPDSTHETMAVTGAICIGCCSILRRSVADEVSVKTNIGTTKHRVVIEHPSGKNQVILYSEQREDGSMVVQSAGMIGTCRLIFEGSVHIKREGLEGMLLNQSKSGLQQEHYEDYHKQLQKDFRKLYKFKSPETDLGAEWEGDAEQEEDEVKPSIVNSAAVSA